MVKTGTSALTVVALKRPQTRENRRRYKDVEKSPKHQKSTEAAAARVHLPAAPLRKNTNTFFFYETRRRTTITGNDAKTPTLLPKH